jgi:hypothetical protein
MTENLPATKTATELYRAEYRDRYVDPFTAFANEGAPGILGQHLQCKKGDWVIGKDATPVAVGTPFLALMLETRRGWIKFGEDGVTADVGLVAEGFMQKHRLALGDTDESQWPEGLDGKPRDPWQKYVNVRLIEAAVPHSDVTFTSTSWGGLTAVQDLCRAFSAERHLHPDAWPVISLQVKTRPSKAFGPIKGPDFKIEGWCTVEDLRTGRKSPAKPKAKLNKAEPVDHAKFDDPLPAWATQ